jgi:hypothetical protein
VVAAPRPHRAQVRTSSSDAHEVSQQVIDEPSGRPRTGVTRRPRLPRRSAEWRAGRTRSLTVVRPPAARVRGIPSRSAGTGHRDHAQPFRCGPGVPTPPAPRRSPGPPGRGRPNPVQGTPTIPGP